MNIHRYYCLEQLEQPCLGKNPGFMSTSRKRRTSQHSSKKIHCEAVVQDTVWALQYICWISLSNRHV